MNSEHRKLYRRIWMKRKRGTSTEELPPPPQKKIKKEKIIQPQKIGKYDHLFEDL